MRINGFVSIATAVPQNSKFAEPNLETKRAGIHRMQLNKKEVRAGRSEHFKKCHSSLGYFFTLHSVIAKNTLLSQGAVPLWIPLNQSSNNGLRRFTYRQGERKRLGNDRTHSAYIHAE